MTKQTREASDLLSGRFAHSYGSLDALTDIDITVRPGEALGIVGPSGCGKSTLLSIVAGLIEQSSGTVSVGGATTTSDRAAVCAYMPQRDLLLPWLTALDNAAIAPRFSGDSRSEARARAARRFERFGLGGFEDSLPTELSGGMRQRVALLRTLTTDRPILCLDEPFSSLDALNRGDLQAWLAKVLDEEDLTCLLVTHDVEESLYLCDRTLVLSGRPGTPVGEVTSPDPRNPDRLATIGEPAFVEARQRVMALLEGTGGPA